MASNSSTESHEPSKPVAGEPAPDWLQRLGQAIRQHPVIILFVILALPAAGVALSLVGADRYESSVTLLVGRATGAPGGDAATRIDGRDAATARELLASPAVAAVAAQRLNSSADDVQDRVEVHANGDADVVEVRARGDSRAEATRTADVYPGAYTAAVGGIEPPSSRPPAVKRLKATSPAETVGGSTLAYGLIGFALAIPLALLAATLVRRLDRKIKDVADLEEIYGLPVLARIPRSRSLSARTRGGRGDRSESTVGFSEEAEAFRALRTNLRYFNVDTPVRSILVASPLPGDGKSTVARHLAVTMASMGDTICLVNADLRKQDEGAVRSSDGLSLVLAGFELDAALTEIPVAFDALSEESRVLVELPNGPLPPNPAELLESARMGWLIGQLERRFDLVIVDSPALVTVSDALTLVPRVSGVLAVGGVGQTMRAAAVDMRKQIDLLDGRFMGVVANFSSASRRYYGYYDQDQAGGDGRRRRRTVSS
jgi:capsular exopolysaccharide synthesis family protein